MARNLHYDQVRAPRPFSCESETAMTLHSAGIHHVTAIAGNAAANRRFYTDVLGLRFVKRTVNFDDPGTWHLYYGDELGRPGTLMTFFPWGNGAGARRGTRGVMQVAFAVPEEALGYWRQRLTSSGLEVEEAEGGRALRFADPDGIGLALTAASPPDSEPWAGGPVPPEHTIRAFHSVTFSVREPDRTRELMQDIFGYTPAEGDPALLIPSGNAGGGAVRVVEDAGTRSSWGAGVVHHVAFRCAGSAEQEQIQQALTDRGLRVTPIVDRRYFKSIYFTEPGSILLEVATDQPGMAIDEPREALGERLVLPTWLEPQRATIEAQLPPL